MKLERQVVSLELSKKLKELGVKQESYWYWHNGELEDENDLDEWSENHLSVRDNAIHAYSVAELGDMLPRGLLSSKGMKDSYVVYQDNLAWVEHWNHKGLDLDFRDLYTVTKSHTEADARAKMLIYLLENNLITL